MGEFLAGIVEGVLEAVFECVLESLAARREKRRCRGDGEA